MFDDQFKSMGKSDKGRAATINKFKKEKFLELSEEEQEQWTQKAITDHKNVKAELKDRQDLLLLLSLQDTQTYVLWSTIPNSTDNLILLSALDDIGVILTPFARAISATLGMHCSIFLGGPEPKRQGQLNLIRYVVWTFSTWTLTYVQFWSIHEGVNKAPVPKVWGEADREKFKEVKSNFLAYLAGCYSESHLNFIYIWFW